MTMIDDAVRDMAIEEIVQKQFGLQVAVKQMIAREIPVSRTATVTIFLTPKHQVFALFQATAAMTLGDVGAMAKRMSLTISEYIPPHHDTTYFQTVAKEKFLHVYPGRRVIQDDELRFYKKLVPYNPALLLVEEVKNDVIMQYDSDASGGWRPSVRFAYRRIRTS